MADATVGLLRLEHAPEGTMVIMGMLSMMLAAGMLPHMVQFLDDAPKELRGLEALHHPAMRRSAYWTLYRADAHRFA